MVEFMKWILFLGGVFVIVVTVVSHRPGKYLYSHTIGTTIQEDK